MKNDPWLRIRNCTVRHAKRLALDAVDIDIERGEFVGLLGPNGAGKSSLLKAMVGLVSAEQGTIFREQQSYPPGANQLRQHLGVVLQTPSLDAKLSTQRNLALTAQLHGLNTQTASKRIDELAELLQFKDRLSDQVKTLSGGLQRRVDIARALISSPQLLLLDEPTAGLDEAAFRQLWENLRELRAQTKLSALVATHRADEAEQCDRLYAFQSGKIVLKGTPEELKQSITGSMLQITANKPQEVQALLQEKLQLTPSIQETRILIEHPKAANLIPKIFDALPNRSIEALTLRQPTLADVFLKICGEELAPIQANP